MGKEFNLKDIVMVFCNTVDQVNPILEHHHRHVSVISYNIGKELNLSETSLTRLVVAAALHDIGALTVEDEKQLHYFDVEDPEPHSLMGKAMLQGFEPFKEIAEMIEFHHVNYGESKDNPRVPFESYIIHLADRIDVLIDPTENILNQAEDLIAKITERKGELFHPEAVEAFLRIKDTEMFWFDIDNMILRELFGSIHLDEMLYAKDKASIEQLVATLSKVIDYKSEFTAAHSRRVAALSGELAKLAGYDEDHIWEVKIAGYMHDYGKLAVPVELINKPTRLTPEEFNVMKSHPYFTYKILKDIKGMEKICRWAASHHEKLDHTGYPMKPSWTEMEEEVEIIIYADVFTALVEERPYRKALPLEKIVTILDEDYRSVVGEKIFEVIIQNQEDLHQVVLQV